MAALTATGASKSARQVVRVLRFLKSGSAQIEARPQADQLLLSNAAIGCIAVPARVCREMVAAGLVRRQDQCLVIEPSGMSHLARDGFGQQQAFAFQHGDVDTKTVANGDGLEQVLVNHAESPLGRLARLKATTGEPFLELGEFKAGNRLRADFSRAQMEPRLGINWDMTGTGRTANGAGGRGELNDAAIAARRRVNSALDAVGPELAGILVDVCCFLKGLANVEQERGWPVRSAKIVLKTALAALSRHYEPEVARPRSGIMHWGGPGYRPSLNG